jgi:amino acid transporter
MKLEEKNLMMFMEIIKIIIIIILMIMMIIVDKNIFIHTHKSMRSLRGGENNE